MLNLDFNNLFEVYTASDGQSGLSKKALEAVAADSNKLEKLWQKIESRGQGFINLPKDNQEIAKIKKYVETIKNKIESVVILGIGGSMLGPRCILDALYSEPNSRIKFYCLDNIDPHKIAEIESQINLEKTLFLVQTKSGGTPETIAQYLYFRSKTDSAKLDALNHFVFVTDPQKGYLRKIATQENITCFDVPQNVGGRYSVLTPIGLLTSELAGLNNDNLLLGALDVSSNLLKESFQLAYVQYQMLQQQKNINVIMSYSSRLKTFSEWTVQLISESLGKEFNLTGNIVNTGLTPLPAVGVTDQHSQLQLFAEGQNDKLIIFIKPQDFEVTLDIPHTADESLSYLNGHSFNELIDAEFKSVQQSLTERLRPNITIQIEKVDEYNLGSLFMLFELATAFVGEMLEINTFDQPGVERSKVLSRENLVK